MAGDRDGERVKALETSLAVVSALERTEGADLATLAAETERSKSTVYKHLETLRAHDYVVKEADTYRLGLRFLDVGGHVRERFPGAKLVKPKVRELAERTGESALFTVEEHGRPVTLFRETGQQGVYTRARVGKRVYLHQIAAGKCILAALPDERVREVVSEHGLPAATGETITDREDLQAELETVRERGYAFNDRESTEGLRAVAAPLSSPDGEVLGACAVAGPSHRMKGPAFREEIPELLLSVVNELELNLTHS